MELLVHYSLVMGCNTKFHQTLGIQNEIIILVWANSLTISNYQAFVPCVAAKRPCTYY
jgi:hypothetical protein